VAPDRLVNLLAVHGDFFGGVDAEADLVAADVHDGDYDVVVDHDRLVSVAAKHKHGNLLEEWA
jgi:hypothetical protein